MSDIFVKGIIPSDGNPSGLIDVPYGSLFYKTGSIYKINYGGMFSDVWQNVFFVPFSKPTIFLTDDDLKRVPVANTGSYLYVKQSSGTDWTF